MIRGGNIVGNPAYTTLPAQPPPKNPQGPTFLQPSQQETGGKLRGQFPNDRLVHSDRHAFFSAGTERTGRRSNLADPLAPGQAPPRPSLRLINRTISHQAGTGNRAAEDNLNRGYRKTNNGREFVGQQDGTASAVYGGTPGLYQPYGSYGGYTTGPVKGVQSPAPIGSPQDGPQKVYPGPPHGLHTATFPDYSRTLGRYMAVPQMVKPTVSRPFNSKIAGQSFSQTVVPLGQVGTAAVSRSTAAKVRGRV